MGFLLFIRWWYGIGWANSFTAITERAQLFAQELSLGILGRTLFEPWKQITLYVGQNASLDDKIHVIFDNVFSRAFGFFIRSMVIVFGTIALAIIFVFGFVLAVVWPIIPFLPVIFVYLAVTT